MIIPEKTSIPGGRKAEHRSEKYAQQPDSRARYVSLAAAAAAVDYIYHQITVIQVDTAIYPLCPSMKRLSTPTFTTK